MEVCLPGNITVTSKASNQSLRRLAIYDMAAIISRQCVSGAGLSRARLLNLRYAALRYHSGQYCPPYLLAGMVKYGVNFATFQPLNAEAICCMTAWRGCGGRKKTKEKWVRGSFPQATQRQVMTRPWSPAPSLVSTTADETWRRGSAGVSSNWKSHKFTELTAVEFLFRPFWRLWGWQQPVAHWGEPGRRGPSTESSGAQRLCRWCSKAEGHIGLSWWGIRV